MCLSPHFSNFALLCPFPLPPISILYHLPHISFPTSSPLSPLPISPISHSPSLFSHTMPQKDTLHFPSLPFLYSSGPPHTSQHPSFFLPFSLPYPLVSHSSISLLHSPFPIPSYPIPISISSNLHLFPTFPLSLHSPPHTTPHKLNIIDLQVQIFDYSTLIFISASNCSSHVLAKDKSLG